MKYWKRGNKEAGTMDDNGFVPGAVECTEQEYVDYITSFPPAPAPKKPLKQVLRERGIITDQMFDEVE